MDALHSTLFKRAGEVLPAGIEFLGQLYRGEGRVLIVSLQVGHGTLHQNVGAAGGRGLAAAGGQRDEQHHLRHLGFKNDVTHLGWQFLALGHPHKKALKIPLVADIRVQHGDAVHPGGVFQVCVAAAGLPEGVVDLDDQTVRVVVINIEDAGVVDLSREVDELADMHQINTAVDAVYLELTDEEPSMDGYFIEGDYTYEITTDGNVRILAYDGSEADVVVPATLGGRDVTEIGNSARPVFDANAAIRSITFPDTLKEMSGLPLFYGCENLETITIPVSVTGMHFHSVADCFIFNCPNLKTIIFKGTRAQWEAIEKESVNLDGITVRCSDDNVDPVQPDPDQPEQPDPGDPDDKDVFLQFEDCSVDVEKPDGTTLHFDALTGVIQSQRLPKGTKVTITLDEKAIPEGMKFSCWVFDDPRPEDLMEDGTTATFTMQEDIGVLARFSTLEEDDSSADFGTIAAATAVVGVVGATAYLVGTEVALNQLLPAGTSVPQDRAQLARLLWNTAGRPEPAALPAFADVTDPDTAKAAQWCVEAGFFQPREDGNFKPGKHVSRWKVLCTYPRIVK